MITDIEGVRVGHWTDPVGLTGCTVILCPDGSVAAADVRGGAPGTLGTDSLRPGTLIPGAHAFLLTGGSAFGLAAANGVLRWLEERGVGFETGLARVPIVAGAVLFDLGVGRPGRAARRRRRGTPRARRATDGVDRRGLRRGGDRRHGRQAPRPGHGDEGRIRDRVRAAR